MGTIKWLVDGRQMTEIMAGSIKFEAVLEFCYLGNMLSAEEIRCVFDDI